jgi:uncharacterized protein (TIGR02466 family)
MGNVIKAELPEGPFAKADFNLFPTLVQVHCFDNHPANDGMMKVIENCKETASWPKDVGHGRTSAMYYDPIGKVHRNTNCLDEPEFAKLKRDIENRLVDYTRTVGIAGVELTKSWFNIQEAEGYVAEHRHDISIVSGAYYPYVDEGSAPIVFRNPILGPKMSERPERNTEFSTDGMEFFPKTGMLVLFPSWLYHRTYFNKTKKRITISFNTRHDEVCYHDLENPHPFK